VRISMDGGGRWMAVWREGISGCLDGKAVHMTLRAKSSRRSTVYTSASSTTSMPSPGPPAQKPYDCHDKREQNPRSWPHNGLRNRWNWS